MAGGFSRMKQSVGYVGAASPHTQATQDTDTSPGAFSRMKEKVNTPRRSSSSKGSASRDWSFFEQGRGSSPARSESGTTSPKLGSIRIPSINKTSSGQLDVDTLNQYAAQWEANHTTNGERFKKTVSGMGKTYLGSVVNAGGVAARVQQGIYSDMTEESIRGWESEIKNWTDSLNAWRADGSLTKEEEEYLTGLIQENQKKIDIYQKAQEARSGASKSTYALADKISASGTQDIEAAKNGLGTIGRFVVDTGVAMGQLGIDIGAAAATGGSAMLPMAVRSFGGGTQQARQEGADEGQAFLYGAASAVLEAATEQIGNIGVNAKFFGKGALDDVMAGMVTALENRARTTTGKAAMKLLGTSGMAFLSEGFEEFVSAIASPVLERVIYSDDPINVGEVLGDALYDFLVGGAVGGISGAAHTATGMAIQKMRGITNANDVVQEEPAQQIQDEEVQPEQQDQQPAREAAILRILEENGVTGTPANRQAQGVAALIDGGELSSNRADEIRKSRAAQAAYTQITGETIDTTGRPAEVRARIKQMALDKAAERNTQNVVETIPTQAAVETATQEATEAPVTPVTTMGTVDTNQAETSPVIQYTPSPASDLDTISQRVSNINLVDRMAQESQVLGEAGRAAAMTRYDGTTDPSGYYAGFMQAYNDGMNGKRNRQNSVLTKEQYNQAYNAGRTDSRAGLTREGAGLVRNASAVKLRDAGTIDSLAKKLGVTVVAEETIFSPDGRKSGVNGYIKGREIHIALDAEDPSMVVFKHEVTHYLQEKSAKSYQAFRDYAVQAMGEDEVRRVQDLYRSRNVDLTWDEAMDEVAANYTENLLTDEEAVRRLIRDDRNLAQKILDAIRGLVQKVTGQEGAKLRQAEKLWTEMFREIAGQEQADRGTIEVRYSEKDGVKNGRAREETRGAFLQRATGEGYAIHEGKTACVYGYRRVDRKSAGKNAGQIQAEVSHLGIEADIISGPILINRNGTTVERQVPQAVTIDRARILINKNSDLAPRNVAGHEAFHLWKSGVGRNSYIETVEDNIDFTSEAFRDYQSSIAYTLFGQDADLSDEGQMARMREELLAYISGDIHEGVNDDMLRPMFRDYDAVKIAWDNLVRKNGGMVYGDSSSSSRFSMKASVDEMQEKYDSLSRRVQELSRKKAQLEKNPEHEKFLEAVYSAKGDALDTAMEQYKKWADENGLSAVASELEDLKRQSQDAFRNLERAKRDALNEARADYRSKFDEAFSKKYASKAARKFGTTSRFDLAGYLTVNGSLLDFSQRQGYRVQDHREIAEILDFLPDYAEYSDGMIEFMNMGNIRLQSYGIDIAKAPNAKQRSMLRKFFNSLDGEVTVDFSRENGNNDGSIDYPEGTRADKILRDIDSYFSTGVVPEQSAVSMFHTRYSIKSTDSQGRKLTKEQQEYFRDSVIRDDKGHLMVMYHISDVDNISVFQSGNSAGIIYFSKSIRDARKAARGSRSIYVCYLNIKNPVNTENNPFYWYEAEDSLRVANWKREGYDGVYVKDESGVSVAVFYPGQIKETENLNPTNTTDIRFSLRQENQRLRELNQYLRDEISDPSVVRTSRNGVKKLASRLVSEYDSTVDKSDISAQLLSLYDFIANGKDASGNELTWTEVSHRAKEIAQDILSGAVAQGNPLYEEYADVRSYVKQQAIVVPKDSRGDFEQFGGWGEFRKRNAGRMKLMNDGLPSDVFYQELSSQWPELFPEDIANPADQMIHTAEVLQYLDAVYENPYQQEMDVYTRYLADEILESFYEVPQRTTYAQRQQLRQTKQAIRYEKRIDSLRQRQKERIADLRAQGRDRIKQAVAEQREESAKKLDALKRKYQSKEAATRDRREAAATRAKIQRHVKKLSQLLLRPSDKSHVPEALKKPVAALLESINLESQYTVDPKTGKRKKNGGGDPTKRTQAFQELRTAYAKIMESGEYLVDPDLQDNLDAVIRMKNKRLVEMNQAELETVWKAVSAMEASIRSANKLLAHSKFESISGIADSLRRENSSKPEKRNYVRPIGLLDGLLNLDMMTPETFFHRLGDPGDAIFHMMRNAADDQTRTLKEAEDYTKDLLDGMKARDLEKELHTFRIDGQDVELSTAQIMELYVLSRRQQAVKHLYMGGIRPTGARKGVLELGAAKPVHVTPQDVANIISTLTDDQILVAEGMQSFLSEEMAEKGNRASMKVYGYKKFSEENYWPIRVDNNQTVTDVAKETAEKMVPQYGMTKQVTPGANNALFIGSIFDSYAKHITEMSIYSAWLATWEDVNRIHNFQFRNSEGARTGTVKEIVTKVFGKNGNGYITNLLRDVSQGTKANADTVFSIRGLTSAYKAASVGANLRVILQQPTAALRALDLIDPKYFLAGMARKGNWDRVKKWAPIAQWKDWGYFEMDTGRAIKDVLLGTDSVLERVKQATMWAAGKADSVTWSRIWNACEAEIADKRPGLKKGSDEFYLAVADRFNQVIDQTQVVDSVLTRTQIMRSSSDLNKMAASFMSEPSKVYNMMLRSVYDLRAASDPAARSAARKRVGRTSFALVASFAANAIAQSLVDAARDDDREKKYLERFVAAYEKNFIANFNPAGYVPYLRDIVSIIQGYDVSRMDMDSISKAINSATNAYKALSGGGKKTVKAAFADLFAEFSRLLGVPVSNIKRDVQAVIMTTAIETENYRLQYEIDRALLNLNYAGNTALFMDTLYGAMKTNRADYEFIYSDLVKNGMDPAKIASGMESRMKEDQGVTSVSDLEQRYLPPDKEKEYQSLLSGVSGTKIWAGATDEQRKNTSDDIYQLIMGTDRSASLRDKISAGSQYGLTEEEMVLYELAKEVASQDGNDNTSQEEAAAAAAMLPGLSDNERAYLWQSTNKGWKDTNNPWK